MLKVFLICAYTVIIMAHIILQKFEIDDKRRVRFSNSMKYVNPNIARELIAQVPPIASKDRVVWCDGGDPHLGHPKVYINLVCENQ